MENNAPTTQARGRARLSPFRRLEQRANPEGRAATSPQIEFPTVFKASAAVLDEDVQNGAPAPSRRKLDGSNGYHAPNGTENGNGSIGSNGNHAPNGCANVNGNSTRPGTEFRKKQSEFLMTKPSGISKKGTSGAPKKFVTNYFQLQTKKNWTMRLHEVTFDPPIDAISKKKALLRTKDQEVGPFIFDGVQLFTTRELPPEAMLFTAYFPDKPEDVWIVTIRFIRISDPLDSGATQLYNLIIRKAQVGMNLVQLGRHFFDGSQKIDVRQHRLELWPGYLTSMRQMEQAVLLNVDLTFKVCRTDDVFTLMKEIRQNCSGDYRRACEEAIVGTIVLTTYNNKTYRVDEIIWDTKATSTFFITRKRVSKEVSFVDYYAIKKYNIKVPNQPMLLSKATKRDIRRGDTGDKLLVPEMCYQTGLNDAMRGNFRLMKDLAQHLHMQPTQRLKKTKEFMANMRQKPEIEAEMTRWGMRFVPEAVEVDGRQIPGDDIIFANQGNPVRPRDNGDWSMAFRNQRMLTTVPLSRWLLIHTNRDAPNIQNLIQNMKRVAGPLGYQISDPVAASLNDPRSNSYERVIDEKVAKAKGNLDMIMMILPSNKLDLYAAVKKKCSVEYGIPSQCFLAKNLNNQKGLTSICTKLVVQMNAKQGGQPWCVKNPLGGVMVVGFDVHHAKGMRSFGAMTATTSNNLASYYSTVNEQLSGMDTSTEIGHSFKKCLVAYYKVNGELPVRIMFYRDGVGEGQLNYVFQSEVQALRGVMQGLYAEAQKAMPKFTMIVVTKRINTRMFEIRGQGRYENPSPGTIVDDVITCPEKYDFYLIPQTARQGTVSPVSFNVLYDESGLDADKLQRFTYKLCHLYYNWSGTVAVPAPCQYARKLAMLTGTALQSAVNERLCDVLHFL